MAKINCTPPDTSKFNISSGLTASDPDTAAAKSNKSLNANGNSSTPSKRLRPSGSLGGDSPAEIPCRQLSDFKHLMQMLLTWKAEQNQTLQKIVAEDTGLKTQYKRFH